MKKRLNKAVKHNHKNDFEAKKKRFGTWLLLPFVIGFIIFFLQPLILSAVYSFNKVDLMATDGELAFKGIDNFYRALLIETGFRDALVSEFGTMLVTVPLIIVFSLICATLLNAKFKGQMLARVILFLPVIVTTGVILSIESGDYMLGMISSSIQGSGAVESSGNVQTDFYDLSNIILSLKLPQQVMDFFRLVIDNFNNVLISSGVQITLLLAALQSISPSLYEASSIEGATGWENFWLITIPMVSPYIFVCTFYSIIDTFCKSTNQVVTYITNITNTLLDYGYASAMSWIYFLIIAVILAVVGLIFKLSNSLFYYDN